MSTGQSVRIDGEVQTLPISNILYEIAQTSALRILQKWSVMGEVTQDDLLTPNPLFVELERKNKFSRNHTTYKLYKNYISKHFPLDQGSNYNSFEAIE